MYSQTTSQTGIFLRREVVKELIQKNYTQPEMAQLLKVCPKIIWLDIQALQNERIWIKPYSEQFVKKSPAPHKRTSESCYHIAMKEHIAEWLRGKGALDIIFEYCYITKRKINNITTHKIIKIDVVGIFSNRKIAVEVGNCKKQKIELLKTVFDEVLHFPYGSLLPT